MEKCIAIYRAQTMEIYGYAIDIQIDSLRYGFGIVQRVFALCSSEANTKTGCRIIHCSKVEHSGMLLNCIELFLLKMHAKNER